MNRLAFLLSFLLLSNLPLSAAETATLRTTSACSGLLAGAVLGDLAKVQKHVHCLADEECLTYPTRKTVLHFVLFDEASMKYVLSVAPALKDVQDRDGSTPLHDAVFQGNAQAVGLLLRLGADASIRDKKGMRPVDLLVADSPDNSEEMLKKFIRHGIEINEQGPCGAPVHIAASRGNVRSLEALKENGADLAQAVLGSLCSSTKEHRYHMLHLLVQSDGLTALSIASMNGHADAVRFLLKEGLLATTPIKPLNDTPLSLAALRGYDQVVEELLSYDAQLIKERPILCELHERERITTLCLLKDAGLFSSIHARGCTAELSQLDCSTSYSSTYYQALFATMIFIIVMYSRMGVA